MLGPISCFLDGELAFWTYAKSQKVANLNRSKSITLLVETGSTYQELRGVEIVGNAEIITDPSRVLAIGESVFARYVGGVPGEARSAYLSSAPKRVGVVVHPVRIVSWDHTKLAGSY